MLIVLQIPSVHNAFLQAGVGYQLCIDLTKYQQIDLLVGVSLI